MNKTGRAPKVVVNIIMAIDKGNIAELRNLLEGGANPTPIGSPLSPIHAAITHFRNGQLVCDSVALRLLLDHGADPNFVDQYSGFAPLEDALAMGDMACAQMLKEAGAKVEKPGPKKPSLLESAVKGAIRTGDNKILSMVLSWGIDPNIRNGGLGGTALHEATWWNKETVVAELLRGGVDPCIADGDGDTALDIAINLKRSDAVQQLLRDAMRSCQIHG